MAHMQELHHILIQTQRVLEGFNVLDHVLRTVTLAATGVEQDGSIDDNQVHEVVDSMTVQLHDAIEKMYEVLREMEQR